MESLVKLTTVEQRLKEENAPQWRSDDTHGTNGIPPFSYLHCWRMDMVRGVGRSEREECAYCVQKVSWCLVIPAKYRSP